ncbi:MAG: hypothetical protein V7645_1921 [Actinomycetota bacterium]
MSSWASEAGFAGSFHLRGWMMKRQRERITAFPIVAAESSSGIGPARSRKQKEPGQPRTSSKNSSRREIRPRERLKARRAARLRRAFRPHRAMAENQPTSAPSSNPASGARGTSVVTLTRTPTTTPTTAPRTANQIRLLSLFAPAAIGSREYLGAEPSLGLALASPEGLRRERRRTEAREQLLISSASIRSRAGSRPPLELALEED